MSKQYLLGFDVGSSSVKASLVDAETGAMAATAFFPEHEAPIKAVKPGWAEQNPQMWWDNAKLALQKIMAEAGAKGGDIKANGIPYQMHGLVCVDKNHINSIRAHNLAQSVATLYPLVPSVLQSLESQILSSQSLQGVTYSDSSQYTASLLIDAITRALKKAVTY